MLVLELLLRRQAKASDRTKMFGGSGTSSLGSLEDEVLQGDSHREIRERSECLRYVAELS
ncbi:MAG: hypothetical protein ABSB96_09115 [Gaiellaceae bacterium]